ncbi:hypothetical protein ElyMa_002094000 [Elysia marginata]|uniref:Uncharacterized protein n=1 Tax=Elysia marginata TaxID=1093978 RepID=A0AAV4FFF8_9GAST|nr:hypothetical protein ElyMa_002094000 [Elysia marginata]
MKIPKFSGFAYYVVVVVVVEVVVVVVIIVLTVVAEAKAVVVLVVMAFIGQLAEWLARRTRDLEDAGSIPYHAMLQLPWESNLPKLSPVHPPVKGYPATGFKCTGPLGH